MRRFISMFGSKGHIYNLLDQSFLYLRRTGVLSFQLRINEPLHFAAQNIYVLKGDFD